MKKIILILAILIILIPGYLYLQKEVDEVGPGTQVYPEDLDKFDINNYYEEENNTKNSVQGSIVERKENFGNEIISLSGKNVFYIKFDTIDDGSINMPKIENTAVYKNNIQKNNEELLFYIEELNFNYNFLKLIEVNEKDNYLYAFTTNIGWDYDNFIVIDLNTIEIIKSVPVEMEGQFVLEFNENYSKVILKTDLKTITIDL